MPKLSTEEIRKWQDDDSLVTESDREVARRRALVSKYEREYNEIIKTQELYEKLVGGKG